jgi:2-polyprenyl-3-methyl-5-hydroxy-6-metoxy-1,4-benzoquinol methylase
MESAQIDYSRHYNNWHSNTPEHVNKMIRLYEQTVLSSFPGDKSARILDVGCGMGFLLLALKKAGYQNLTGVDSDKRQVDACVANGLQVQHVTDTIAYLNGQPGSYQVITAFDVLEHVPANVQINFLKSISKALSPDGTFIVTVPNANSTLASRNRYIDYTHHVLFTEVSLDFVLYNAGFHSIQIRPLDYVTYSFTLKSLIHRLLLGYFRFHRRLEMIAELGTTWGKKVPLTFNLMGIAKKSMYNENL